MSTQPTAESHEERRPRSFIASETIWTTDSVDQPLSRPRRKEEVARRSAGPLRNFEKGLSVQTLHVGSYDNEGPLIAELHHTYLPTHDLTPHGKHHETYLNDPRKTEPAKLKVILRQPVTRGE